MPINERTIFEAALEVSDPKARQTFIEKACEGNGELMSRVIALLKSHETAGSFLEIPAVERITPVTAADQTLIGPSISPLPSPTEIFNALTPAISDTPLDAASNAATDDDEDEHRFDLSFLQPSTKAGSIGMLGHYEVLKVLGQGGFGVVFKAFDEKLHRHVAIKVMNPQMAATSPPRKRFLREARSAAAIRHENIVAVHSVEEQPLPYLVMEFIDGQTLQQKLDENGPLDVTEVLYLGQQIASGLAAAHALSFIHRDIKPGNILIEGDVEQKVKITDFGLARAADDASLTRSGMISGTPMYMAPEQATGQSLDHRTDLFSLGSVLYQMACGRPPFRAPNTVAVLRRVAEDTPRALQEIVPELPDWLVAIINKLLAKKPEDRFQSAKEVAELLGRCRTELQLSGRVTCVTPDRAESVNARSTSNEFRAAKGSEGSRPAPASGTTGNVTHEKGLPPVKQKLTAKRVAVSLLLGLLIVSPILFGRHLSRVVSSWFWGPIQTLPAVERAAGLRFDGQDDFVQVPVQWDHPQFTIEAFVTPEEAGSHRSVVELTNYGSGAKDERLELYDAVGGKGERLSHATVTGRSGSLSAFGPQTPGVREHRAIVCDGQEIHYYINGVWQGKRNNQPQDNQLWRMRWLTIGCQLGEKNFFKGEIDQLRISKVARYTDNFPAVSLVESDDATLALYNFEEGTGDVLKDLSGNGHDAKISGATWIHPAQGLQFDGVDDYVEFTGLTWNSNQYTIEAYISQDGGHGNLFQTAGTGGMLHMYLYPQGGGAGINRDQVYANANGPRKGKPRQHLAVVYDGQNLNYFVQGQLVGVKTNVSAAATPMSLDRMTIGSKLQNDPNKPEFFEGRLEQLRVSDNVRYVLPFTPGELKTDGETLALYDFTTGEGEVIKDSCGKSPDGKIVGATWVQRRGIGNNSAEGWHGWPTDAPPPAIAPFDTEQAKQHQAAWASYLKVPAEFTDKHGMKFVLIPPGEFQMGFSQTELDTLTRELKQAGAGEFDLFSAATSGPQHPVRITQPFYMAAHEVTVSEYRRFIDETHYLTTAEQLGGQRKKWSEYLAPENPDQHPVLGVSWTDTEAYCKHRGEQDGVTYRLPSEAEWEYACRAGTTTLWSFGDNPAQIGENAVTAPEGTSTQPVGSRTPNPLGVFDMYGNADEWCLDWHAQDFYATCPTDDPVNLKTPTDANSGRVARGGGTISLPWQVRSSTRRWDFPSTPVNLKGFRVVITGDLKKAATNLGATGWHGWPADAPPPAIAPFKAEQAQQHQAAWAKYLNVPVEYTNSIGMKFVLIPPGEFTMGSTAEEINEFKSFNTDDPHWNECLKSEAPIRRITLSSAFYLGTYEVTQGEYQRVTGSNPSHFANGAKGEPAIEGKETTMHPVETLSWNDAASFGEKLGALEKVESIAPVGYRLPTEQEWEFACRAGATGKFCSGDSQDDLNSVAWTQANSDRRTHAAGELRPNQFGLFDVHGNVWEWVQDRWRIDDYSSRTSTPPALQSQTDMRVVRGGDLFGFAPGCRSSHRYSYVASHQWSNIGFRLVLSIDAVRGLSKRARPEFPDSEPGNARSNSVSTEWLDRDSKLSAEEQVKEFTAEMKRRNPEWDAVVTPKIDGGQVVSITFDSLNVKDLSPIAALSSLKELIALSSQINGELSDLTPLAKLKSLSTVFFLADAKRSWTFHHCVICRLRP